MARTNMVGKTATTVTNVNGIISTIYHNTNVIRIDTNTKEITLNSGGWRSNTTKLRINQTVNQYLGYGCNVSVYQDDYDWFVITPAGVIPFEDRMKFSYAEPEVSVE